MRSRTVKGRHVRLQLRVHLFGLSTLLPVASWCWEQKPLHRDCQVRRPSHCRPSVSASLQVTMHDNLISICHRLPRVVGITRVILMEFSLSYSPFGGPVACSTVMIHPGSGDFKGEITPRITQGENKLPDSVSRLPHLTNIPQWLLYLPLFPFRFEIPGRSLRWAEHELRPAGDVRIPTVGAR